MANGMKMWKRYGNTTTLLFSLKGLEIVHQERRGQVKTIVMEYFKGILFHKSGPANKQHTSQSINQPYHKPTDVINRATADGSRGSRLGEFFSLSLSLFEHREDTNKIIILLLFENSPVNGLEVDIIPFLSSLFMDKTCKITGSCCFFLCFVAVNVVTVKGTQTDGLYIRTFYWI